MLQCDADRDGIVDLVEETICGSATCATGAEDNDGNGVADATELAESLQTGGPGGPIQPAGRDALIVVTPDGTLAVLSLWPVAGLAALLLAGLSAYVLARHRNRNVRPAAARHSMKELVR